MPHEGLLGRIATAIVAGEAVVLAAVGVAGARLELGRGLHRPGAGHRARPAAQPRPQRPAPGHRRARGGVSLTPAAGCGSSPACQAVVYLLLFAFGAAFSLNTGNATFLDLNTPDLVLHGVLALLGFIVLMISSARIIEPPPGPLPYPDAVPSAQENSRTRASAEHSRQRSPAAVVRGGP